jgi:hypothetical protein
VSEFNYDKIYDSERIRHKARLDLEREIKEQEERESAKKDQIKAIRKTFYDYTTYIALMISVYFSGKIFNLW